MRKMLIVFIGALTLVATAHALPEKRGREAILIDSAAPGSLSPHGSGNTKTALQGMAGVIQDVTLPGYKNMKIGEAFGKYRYFKKKEWSESRGVNGNYYVDFVGSTPTSWFDFKSRKQGISARGVEVKFVIYPDGAYEVGMVSKVEVKTDGKTYRYPFGDAKSIVDAIYANREIPY